MIIDFEDDCYDDSRDEEFRIILKNGNMFYIHDNSTEHFMESVHRGFFDECYFGKTFSISILKIKDDIDLSYYQNISNCFIYNKTDIEYIEIIRDDRIEKLTLGEAIHHFSQCDII